MGWLLPPEKWVGMGVSEMVRNLGQHEEGEEAAVGGGVAVLGRVASFNSFFSSFFSSSSTMVVSAGWRDFFLSICFGKDSILFVCLLVCLLACLFESCSKIRF